MTPLPIFLLVLLALVALEQVRRRRSRLPKGTRWLPGPPGNTIPCSEPYLHLC